MEVHNIIYLLTVSSCYHKAYRKMTEFMTSCSVDVCLYTISKQITLAEYFTELLDSLHALIVIA